MAQDAHESGIHPIDSHNSWEEKTVHFPDYTEAHLAPTNSNTRSENRGRNHTPDPSGSAQLQEKSTIGDNGHQNTKPQARTLPPWIRSVDYPIDETEASPSDRLLPPEPDDALVAQHNHSPYTATKPERPGTKPDGEQRRESRWKNFSRDIAYPREDGVEHKYVTPDWLNENMGEYSTPWGASIPAEDDSDDPLRKKRRQQFWFIRLHHHLLRSPIVPLILRLTVWSFSLAALALGGSIQHLSSKYNHPQGPSGLMAIIVDAVALVYLVYITWDEYTAKPLGLRPAIAKARLILLDIFFIVFDSANLSLAFETITSIRGSCEVAEINSKIQPKNDAICDRQKALASVLLIALIAWLMTFSISVLRLVARVTQ